MIIQKYISLFWVIVLLFTVSDALIRNIQYECGAHGRFEYCIDGFPGCVVGCHCHPGYYFDPDTKICEPNTKLVHDYRRHYSVGPTRVDQEATLAVVLYDEATTELVTDAPADISTTTENDLSNWLYNQFFKKIENQIMDDTKNETVLHNRRSGSGGKRGGIFALKPSKKPKRKARKKGRSKKKSKKGELRRKMLRMSSSDTSSSTSSSDEDSDSSSSSGSTSASRESHDHEQFFVLNKKPPPTLPSFIFLPNIETPFFPPIGLPAPAVPMIPMYPPAVPMFPFPSATVVHTTEGAITNATVATTTSNTPVNEITTTVSSLRHHGHSGPRGNKMSHSDRKRLMQHKLRQRLKSEKSDGQYQVKPKIQPLIKLEQEASSDILGYDDMAADPNPLYPDLPPGFNNAEQQFKIPKSNLKYLSQLIHRQDTLGEPPLMKLLQENPPLGDSLRGNDPPIPARGPQVNFAAITPPPGATIVPRLHFNLPTKSGFPFPQRGANSAPPAQVKTQPPAPSRRAGTINYAQDYLNNNAPPDDSFYSNLGKQIASLIREKDKNDASPVDAEIKQMADHHQPSVESVFFENAPRTYWERAVRSSKKEYDGKLHHLKKSNPVLFDLEDRVNDFVTTAAPLNLDQLENSVVYMKQMLEMKRRMENAKKLQNNSHKTTTPKVNVTRRTSAPNDTVVSMRVTTIELKLNDLMRALKRSYFRQLMPPPSYNQSLFMIPRPRYKVPSAFDYKLLITSPERHNQIKAPAPANTTLVLVRPPKKLESHSSVNWQALPPMRPSRPKTTVNDAVLQANPNILNYRNVKNYYHSGYPVPQTVFKDRLPFFHTEAEMKKPAKSYFHHEMHHFDYFD